jgi:prephenate dehydrogenase
VVIGIDLSPEIRATAVANGIVDQALEALPGSSWRPRLTILATPVRTIIALLEQLRDSGPAGGWLLDVGSTKADICRAMEGLTANWAAIGGHPLCGREVAGLGAATGDLFQDRTFVLCRTARTTPAVEEAALAMIDAIRARPLFLAPEEHDRLVAGTSHLPYVLAATLARVVAASEDERVNLMAASGLRDTSRLAGSDPQMMLDILLTNREAIVAHLEDAGAELAELLPHVAAGDEAWLRQWLEGAQAAHRQLQTARPPES